MDLIDFRKKNQMSLSLEICSCIKQFMLNFQFHFAYISITKCTFPQSIGDWNR